MGLLILYTLLIHCIVKYFHFRSSGSLTPVSVSVPDRVTRRFSTSSVALHSPSVCTSLLFVYMWWICSELSFAAITAVAGLAC